MSTVRERIVSTSSTGFKQVQQEESEMAFVNEYVSEEDIRKYKLDEIWLKYHPAYKTMPSHYRHEWTVDREREAYLYWMDVGREEYSNRLTFMLCWKGELFEVKLDRAAGGSKNYQERPYRIIWELVDLWPMQLKTATREEILDILKEALTVRGDDGIRSYVTDTVVEFKNF